MDKGGGLKRDGGKVREMKKGKGRGMKVKDRRVGGEQRKDIRNTAGEELGEIMQNQWPKERT